MSSELKNHKMRASLLPHWLLIVLRWSFFKRSKTTKPPTLFNSFCCGTFCVWGCSHYCFCMFNSPSLISNDKWTLNWSSGEATSTFDLRRMFYSKFILTMFLIFQMSFISSIWHQVFRSIVIIGPYYLNDHWFCCWRWNDQRHNWRSAAVSVRRHQQTPKHLFSFWCLHNCRISVYSRAKV